MTQDAILITGAAGGIGQALLAALAQDPQLSGYVLLATDLPDNLAELHKTPLPETVLTRELDVTNNQALDSLLTWLASEYRLRGLAQLAGVLDYGPALERDPAALSHLIEVNALAVARICDAVARIMLAQAHADPAGGLDRSIVTVASNAGNGPRANMAAYGASKAFASHYTRSLGLELGQEGIRCNVVNPGTTLTPMLYAMWQGQDQSETAITGSPDLYRTGIPLQRVAQPEDIAAPIAFLLSPAARHITLTELTVDGGATQR